MTQQLEHVTWTVTHKDPSTAIRVFRSVEQALTERRGEVQHQSPTTGRWTGPEIRVYVEGAAALLADGKYGSELHRIARDLTREGRVSGIFLTLEWRSDDPDV